MAFTDEEVTARLKAFIDKAKEQNPIERKIIKRVYKALKAAGTPVKSVWDGVEDTKVSTLEEVYTQVFNLDSAHLYTKGGGWVFLVMGNEWDAISDYTLDLEDTLKPVNDWIESNWE